VDDGDAGVPTDAEARIGAALAPTQLLGAKQHGAQDFVGVASRTGPVCTGGVEPLNDVPGPDLVDATSTEGGEDPAPEVDANGLALRELPVGHSASC